MLHNLKITKENLVTCDVIRLLEDDAPELIKTFDRDSIGYNGVKNNPKWFLYPTHLTDVFVAVGEKPYGIRSDRIRQISRIFNRIARNNYEIDNEDLMSLNILLPCEHFKETTDEEDFFLINPSNILDYFVKACIQNDYDNFTFYFR